MSYFKETPEGFILSVQISPGSARSSIEGVVGDDSTGFYLKLRIAAPPEEGKANSALLKFLAKSWKIPLAECSILSGHTARKKRVLICPRDDFDKARLRAVIESRGVLPPSE